MRDRIGMILESFVGLMHTADLASMLLLAVGLDDRARSNIPKT